jgi:prepilin-type N-terminal cleavage/methylation domain-containing protein/prepilin-type processing-associated H-X9-DG protein
MGMMRSARCVRGALGFTLIEVLVTTGIIAVLISVLIPSLSKARSVARQTREVASGQQVMTAFHAYATDDKDRVLTGFASPAMVNGNMIVRDATGQRLHSATGRIEEAQRYPFRIAPYFNYDFSGLYHDPAQLRDWVNNPENYLNYGRDLTYMLSLYPSLGMNVAFVGGSDQLGQFDPIFQKIFGRVYVDRLPDVRRPSGLMAFGSARGVAPPGMEIGQLPEGFFRIEPPYYSGAQGRRWATAYEKGSPVPGLNSGFVSLRHAGKGVVAYVDGHVGVAGWSEFEDMRLWADKADSPTWAIQPQ